MGIPHPAKSAQTDVWEDPDDASVIGSEKLLDQAHAGMLDGSEHGFQSFAQLNDIHNEGDDNQGDDIHIHEVAKLNDVPNEGDDNQNDDIHIHEVVTQIADNGVYNEDENDDNDDKAIAHATVIDTPPLSEQLVIYQVGDDVSLLFQGRWSRGVIADADDNGYPGD